MSTQRTGDNLSDNPSDKPTAKSDWIFAPRTDPAALCRVVLVEPLIPENTGNISRTCVATRSELHLVEPMAFELTETRVKRAGLDYWADLAWQKHTSFESWRGSLKSTERVFCVETNAAKTLYDVKLNPQ